MNEKQDNTRKVVHSVREIKLDGKYVISMSHTLNEMRRNKFTHNEKKFLAIYLGMIKPDDVTTRTVGMRLDNFREVMGITEAKLAEVDKAMEGLLKKVFHFPKAKAKDGWVKYTLFTMAHLGVTNDGEWAVEMKANEDALDMFFMIKEHWRYVKYSMWTSISLKSENQMRMYELLKQRELLGQWEVALIDLRELLGIWPDEYLRFSDFKTRVLDACQAALAEFSDINYTYELVRARVKGGKVKALRFAIAQNPDFVERALDPEARADMEELVEIGVPEVLADSAGAWGEKRLPRPDIHAWLEKMEAREAELAARPAPPPIPAWLPAYRTALGSRLSDRQLTSLRALVRGSRPEVALGSAQVEQAKAAGLTLAAAEAWAEARHLGYWFDYAMDKEREGAITKSFFAYLKKVAAQPVPGSVADEERRRKDEDARAARPAKKNAFHNFKQREYDWAAIEKLERAYNLKKLGIDPAATEEEIKTYLARMREETARVR